VEVLEQELVVVALEERVEEALEVEVLFVE
jgi:hypothetical protein